MRISPFRWAVAFLALAVAPDCRAGLDLDLTGYTPAGLYIYAASFSTSAYRNQALQPGDFVLLYNIPIGSAVGTSAAFRAEMFANGSEPATRFIYPAYRAGTQVLKLTYTGTPMVVAASFAVALTILGPPTYDTATFLGVDSSAFFPGTKAYNAGTTVVPAAPAAAARVSRRVPGP